MFRQAHGSSCTCYPHDAPNGFTPKWISCTRQFSRAAVKSSCLHLWSRPGLWLLLRSIDGRTLTDHLGVMIQTWSFSARYTYMPKDKVNENGYSSAKESSGRREDQDGGNGIVNRERESEVQKREEIHTHPKRRNETKWMTMTRTRFYSGGRGPAKTTESRK